MEDGDILRITVPLDDSYSFDFVDEPQKAVRQHRIERIIEIILDNPHITRIELSSLLRVSEATIKRDLSELNKRGEIEYIGSSKAGKWVVK